MSSHFHQNCLPAYWKSQENGRERFCRLFVPGAALATALGFLQPVSYDGDADDDNDGHDHDRDDYYDD